jgi:hypothetical protein
MILGAKHVESPFIELGQLATAFYFSYFLIIVPLISLLENTLFYINKISNKVGLLNIGGLTNISNSKGGLRTSKHFLHSLSGLATGYRYFSSSSHFMTNEGDNSGQQLSTGQQPVTPPRPSSSEEGEGAPSDDSGVENSPSPLRQVIARLSGYESRDLV